MAHIRIAQLAWDGASAADEITPSTVGLNLPWVEIDGHRITDLFGASIAVGAERGQIGVPHLTIDLIGTVELVYLDKDGNEIGAQHADPRGLVGNTYEYQSVYPIPEPADIDMIATERDRAVQEVEVLRRRLSELMGGVEAT